ncbi:hypothetical protein EDB87DRAFT_1689701 [Lactarius vividus]|nr:hypothetical protein EDB87DRAFT_1689701 [Lactarius vividus]
MATSAPIPPAISAAAAWAQPDKLAAALVGDELTVCVDSEVVLGVLVDLVFVLVEVVVELRELVVVVVKTELGNVRVDDVPGPVVEDAVGGVDSPKGGRGVPVSAQSTDLKGIMLAYLSPHQRRRCC